MIYQAGSYRPQTQEEVNRAVYYWETRKKSLEAYIKTIDPYGGEFDHVMEELFTIRDELFRLNVIGSDISVRTLLEMHRNQEQATP